MFDFPAGTRPRSHHGGYVTPPSAHRGGPPSREVCHERATRAASGRGGPWGDLQTDGF